MSSFPAETCTFTLSRVSSDICYIRLDFVRFYVTQPQKDSGGTSVANGWECSVDTLTFTAPPDIPVVCGEMTGQHMYLEAQTYEPSMTLAMIGAGIDRYIEITTRPVTYNYMHIFQVEGYSH